MWQTKHKYLISFLPHGSNVQLSLVPMLEDIKHSDLPLNIFNINKLN